MRKASLLKKIVILVMILALPGFLYYLLTAKGKNRYKPLAFYGPKVVAKTGHKFHGKYIPDTIYHTVGDFSLVDQDGERVSSKAFDNKIIVASLFYTGCPGVCQTVNNNLKGLTKNYAKNKMVYFASITVDPEKDTPTVLKKYSAQYNAGNKWMFLTGDTTTIYNLARNGLLVNAFKSPDGTFILDDKLVLIDGQKRVRGYYSGTSMPDMIRLSDEIKVQISEELRKVDKALY